MRTLLFAAWLAAGGIGIGYACEGCKEPDTALKAKEDAAEASYAAALLRCVDKAKTLEDSHKCRDQVRLEWNVVEVLADGGKP